MMKPLSFALAASILLTVLPAQAENDMLIILDASNSMWGQVDEVAKIETARDVLSSLVTDLPPGTRVGLMAYGHREKESCTDVELISAIGSVDKVALNASIAKIQPRGKTPIAYALEQGGKALLVGETDGAKNIVLISDGIETCGGDPCAVAAALVGDNVNSRVHVVGFSVDEEAKAQLVCIADKGKGQYFSADSTQGFKDALAEVKKVAVKEPDPEPVMETVFEDQFEGEDIADHWEVLNPDPNGFIAEAGTLLMISNVKTAPDQEDMPNVIKLAEPLPQGDWEIEIALELETNTGDEAFYIGVMDDHENWLGAGIASATSNTACGLDVFIDKYESGKHTVFSQRVLQSKSGYYSEGWPACRNDKEPLLAKDTQAMLIYLRKVGRNYAVSAQYGEQGSDEFRTIDLQEIKMLRPRKQLFVGLGLTYDSGGEVAAHVDYIKINKLTKPK